MHLIRPHAAVRLALELLYPSHLNGGTVQLLDAVSNLTSGVKRMSFLKAQNLFLAILVSILMAGGAWATPIGDEYIGAGNSVIRDVIGNHDQFDIERAEIERVGDILNVRIHTQFAGLADNKLFSWYTAGNRGIGYGDLFLAPTWNPSGDAPYLGDDYTTGTKWTHAFSLDDRWSDKGGFGTFYEIDPDKIQLSDDFISGASFRSGQEVAVTGGLKSLQSDSEWYVSNSNFIEFAIDISNADTLLASEYIAFHWTMTCGNDVIEGQAPNSVPEPSSMLLLGLGLIGVAGLGRSKLRAK